MIDNRTEVRRYPELVRVETVGDSNRETFRWLFEYISGENASVSSISMTSPVRTSSAFESDDNDEIGLEHVPLLHRGEWNRREFEREPAGKSAFGDTREGYVVRTTDAFAHHESERAMAKCVRENHVQTDDHWKHGPIETNGLAER